MDVHVRHKGMRGTSDDLSQLRIALNAALLKKLAFLLATSCQSEQDVVAEEQQCSRLRLSAGLELAAHVPDHR
jgi:hypothetical protein